MLWYYFINSSIMNTKYIESVSYTDLDVYKRQTKRLS